MTPMEITLLIIGVIIFCLSFLLKDKSVSGTSEIDEEKLREEIRRITDKEYDGLSLKVKEATDSSIEYAMEKSERALEKISNEKIMAVSEYSNTIMEEINKSHKEVMFLYDMLNEKSVNLKNTAASVDKKVKEAKETKEELETVKEPVKETVKESAAAKEPEVAPEAEPENKILGDDFATESTQEVMDFGGDFMDSGSDGRNEEIIRLHKAGKSNVAIAKELDMGVGEVKLVIGLFEGGKK